MYEVEQGVWWPLGCDDTSVGADDARDVDPECFDCATASDHSACRGTSQDIADAYDDSRRHPSGHRPDFDVASHRGLRDRRSRWEVDVLGGTPVILE